MTLFEIRESVKILLISLAGTVIAVAAGVLLAWLLGVSDAGAQGMPGPPKCGPFNEISKQLESVAHEVQISGGIISEQSVLIIFAEPKGKTWTSVVVDANSGTACIVSMGQDWFQLPILSGEPI